MEQSSFFSSEIQLDKSFQCNQFSRIRHFIIALFVLLYILQQYLEWNLILKMVCFCSDKGFYANPCFKTYHSAHGAKNTHSQSASISLPILINFCCTISHLLMYSLLGFCNQKGFQKPNKELMVEKRKRGCTRSSQWSHVK